jgi:RES domain-containing protein
VKLWRIAQEHPSFPADDLSGTGPKISGGRWNSPGNPMVYASTSIALALLETVVHLSGPPAWNRYLVEIEVPDEVWTAAERLLAEQLPGWDAIPAGVSSIAFGDRWLLAARSALLRVPSVVVPREENVLIHPHHPDTARLSVRKLERVLYDPRFRS